MFQISKKILLFGKNKDLRYLILGFLSLVEFSLSELNNIRKVSFKLGILEITRSTKITFLYFSEK